MRIKAVIGLGTFLQLMAVNILFSYQSHAQVIDRIVAIVDSEIITLVDVQLAAKPYVQQLETAGYPQDKFNEMEKQIHQKVLDVLIEQSLTEQESKKYGISVSDQEIENAVENLKRQRSISQEEFEKILKEDDLTVEAYKESIKKKILQSKLINRAVKSKVVITESEIKAYYEENHDLYAGVKQYHLRNILMTDENAINAVYKKLTQKKKFATLAKNNSQAPNASDGGDLGFFDIENFDETIKKQIENLKEGEFTRVIKTAQGYQIFYVQNIDLKGNKTFEQAHDEIYDKLYEPKIEEKFKKWIKSLKEQAHIEIKL